jgi:predicted transcriptional regulator
MSARPETKVGNAWPVLYTDYANLIGHDAIGFYYHLIWLHSRGLARNITFDYIKSKLRIDDAYLIKTLKKLAIFDLVKRTGVENNGVKDFEFEAKNPSYLSKVQKIEMVNKMFAKNIIDEAEKESALKYISETSKDEHNDGQNSIIEEFAKEKDFSNGSRQVGEDTFVGLVRFYYKYLGEVFGGKYKSHKEETDAAVLRNIMTPNGDTAEMTREFFKWIIDRAKKHNKFESVSSMSWYADQRKHAYYHLNIKQTGDKKFEETVVDNTPEVDKIMKNIKGVYSVYVSENMPHEEIVANILLKNFDEKAVEQFLETLDDSK